MRQFDEKVTSPTGRITKGERNVMGRNSTGILQGAQHNAGLVGGSANAALTSNSPDFTQSPFLVLSTVGSVYCGGIFSSRQSVDFVISRGRSVLAGTGAFLVKQTP